MSDDDDRDVDVETDAEKRAHHNALERNRRDHIKGSFHSLRDSVPCIQGEKASRAQILSKATEYIDKMKRINSIHQDDIDEMKQQNQLLEAQVHMLEHAKVGKVVSESSPVNGATVINRKGITMSVFDGGSDSDTQDLQERPAHRKKLKTSV
ncbi:PREDICTED: protein max-like isoform X2 [Priapulus caudatus]|uniref:Protein max-like isoform X2 n=1 Tax=Priapulus caudatus TaxID=37621 RepID=A0ABM1EK21_PRICU|nr:PREDICTED: protein max-like isoform X2 [Priapulus caudatus]